MNNQSLSAWVEEVARQTEPDRVVWCDGSEEEYRGLVQAMLRDGTLHELDQVAYSGCYLHRSHPSDVARTEHLTFICSDRAEDAGPTNNWMSPTEAREKVGRLFDRSMRGRTMYVVPYLMGPAGSSASKVGVEITDSAYVAASMRIMTRMGKVALEHLGTSSDFCRGLHSLGDLDPERRFIAHFPEERLIWSVGSGYGGNALLGKKCFALRIASTMGRDEGWLAEHMLIMGLEDPSGNVTYICAAFPSACGKTNLAMMVPPASQPGWKVWTVGDDIAWLRVGADGRLWAVNPEAGFFGVAPGTSRKTNPHALATVQRNTIFTNVAMTRERHPWWEGMDGQVPAELTDWKGRPWTPASKEPAAHPNSRFCVPAKQCPSVSSLMEAPEGVPISAFVFGGRRAKLAPLVYESRDWAHGVYLGASMASETTAAATGKVGVVRRDPMAMRPFCGYNMGDYFRHWLEMGRGRSSFPKVFHVNWFRQNEAGKFLWPGFGENLRVLRWINDRVHGRAKGHETALGIFPAEGELDTSGLDLHASAMSELFSIDRDAWIEDLADQEAFFGSFGDKMPEEIWREHRALRSHLSP
ncbi:phosphoenolpyruvate carboxykinase (GTP) [Polyangium spumosum]|uniref:Phosphoenolpyruvate carboxykinase [GTP] n=1 Tax=Polyangium spumosum TaxID=889282 RepID=A0A6N7PUY2_9BACT|nr:phosphoenolpyruvate carboxykinase (GTP) [Polyangium spumosum]MRG96042.1 phosphoenolpyruvate carboxykinase (GTP) [Polyangium spumosum]